MNQSLYCSPCTAVPVLARSGRRLGGRALGLEFGGARWVARLIFEAQRRVVLDQLRIADHSHTNAPAT